MELKNRLGESVPVMIAIVFLVTFFVVLIRIPRQPNVAPTDYRDDYARAVHAAMQPDNVYVSRSLVAVNLKESLTVLTWTQREKVPDFLGKTAPKDTWVTVVPQLKTFCQNYVESHGADSEHLNLRLRQRLGLPPTVDYDMFVELRLDPKDVTKFYRPCGDPSADTTSCEPASPAKSYEIRNKLKTLDLRNSKDVQQYWLLANYYQSFASNDQFPWTSLGYTFDWAKKEDASGDFVRWGESEFVIATGTPIQLVSKTETLAYCTPH
jgi:hypothetical protein